AYSVIWSGIPRAPRLFPYTTRFRAVGHRSSPFIPTTKLISEVIQPAYAVRVVVRRGGHGLSSHANCFLQVGHRSSPFIPTTKVISEVIQSAYAARVDVRRSVHRLTS